MSLKLLEKIAVERPKELRFNFHTIANLPLYDIGELYDAKLGNKDISPTMQSLHERELENLELPKKLSIHKEVKKLGKKYIFIGEVRKGAYCLGASHYFWQNFVVIEGDKA